MSQIASNYEKFLNSLNRLRASEIAQYTSSSGTIQMRWRSGYIQWRQDRGQGFSAWTNDASSPAFHVRVWDQHDISWLNGPPEKPSSHIRRVEL